MMFVPSSDAMFLLTPSVLYSKPPLCHGGYLTVPTKPRALHLPHLIDHTYIQLQPFSWPLSSFQSVFNSFIWLTLFHYHITFPLLPELHSRVAIPLFFTDTDQYLTIPLSRAHTSTLLPYPYLPLLVSHPLWPSTTCNKCTYKKRHFFPSGSFLGLLDHVDKGPTSL
jgi:hypothetical protein